MHLISHFHPATASSVSIVLHNFIPGHPRLLAVVRHTVILLLALPSPSQDGTAAPSPSNLEIFKEVARIELNARIVALRQVSPPSVPAATEKGKQTKLVILTDHHQSRLIVVRYDASKTDTSQPFATEAVLQLEEIARPAAELGMGLAMEEEGASAQPEYIVSHTHSGLLKVVPIAQGSEVVDKKGKGKAGEAKTRRASSSKKGRLSGAGILDDDADQQGVSVQTQAAFGVR